jgi:hypothetical protein
MKALMKRVLEDLPFVLVALTILAVIAVENGVLS